MLISIPFPSSLRGLVALGVALLAGLAAKGDAALAWDRPGAGRGSAMAPSADSPRPPALSLPLGARPYPSRARERALIPRAPRASAFAAPGSRAGRERLAPEARINPSDFLLEKRWQEAQRATRSAPALENPSDAISVWGLGALDCTPSTAADASAPGHACAAGDEQCARRVAHPAGEAGTAEAEADALAPQAVAREIMANARERCRAAQPGAESLRMRLGVEMRPATPEGSRPPEPLVRRILPSVGVEAHF